MAAVFCPYSAYDSARYRCCCSTLPCAALARLLQLPLRSLVIPVAFQSQRKPVMRCGFGTELALADLRAKAGNRILRRAVHRRELGAGEGKTDRIRDLMVRPQLDAIGHV